MNVCRLLIVAGDCETICDVLLDIIPMLEEVNAAAAAFAVMYSESSDPKLLSSDTFMAYVRVIFEK